MAITCSRCGRDYDVTLFQFGRTVRCECGNEVTLSGGRKGTQASNAAHGVKIMSLHAPLFDLHHTLASGQVFRYCRTDGGYRVIAGNRILRLRQTGDVLEFSGADEAFVRRFLGLDDDLAAILRRLGKIPQLRRPIEACRGLRIVRHDLWECLVSFICSTNSNIPKIRRSLDLMAEIFGKPITCGEDRGYAFPEIGSLNDLAGLRQTGIGYRADFVFEANSRCSRKLLDEIAAMNYEDAREALKCLPGVGDKVADCVCLFSLGHHEAFPVDVWVARAMQELFPSAARNPREIRKVAADIFGPDAGYAQQYLFHYLRNCRSS